MLHHIALSASNLSKSALFYDGILQFLGYEQEHVSESICVWDGQQPEILLYQADATLRHKQHKLYQPGFHHLAFSVSSRELINQIYQWLTQNNYTILEPPKAYPNYPGDYYAVFFTDPDNLKLEVMCN